MGGVTARGLRCGMMQLAGMFKNRSLEEVVQCCNLGRFEVHCCETSLTQVRVCGVEVRALCPDMGNMRTE
jgi:hypothetical protein